MFIMRVPIRFGIIATFVFVTVMSFTFLAYWITNRIRPNYLKLVEENLVDTSLVLAAYVSKDLRSNQDAFDDLGKVFDQVNEHSFSSTIYDVTKESVDLRVYVTDEFGIVRFHSDSPELISTDFSKWLNISRTLRGQYGARATRTDPGDAKTLVLHVSAPITIEGMLKGVLTVEKPITWATIFIEDARKEIILASIATGAVALILSLLMSAWLLRPIGRLTQYARLASEGKRVYLPSLGKAKELQDMGKALQTMHTALEGKHYVEHYIQALTHEIKSPVSAIRGAAELINDDMTPENRERFLSNIKSESNRINQIVDRLLELSAVEQLQYLEVKNRLNLTEIVEQVAKAFETILNTHHLKLKIFVETSSYVLGDAFLITRAVGNVLQNAIDFSPEGGIIRIRVSTEAQTVCVVVKDQGGGIPEFAVEKIFDRFFSMPRPGSNKKSSGLGLVFVKEIMDLHSGTVSVQNRPTGGAKVVLTFQAA
jgi:two-component system, OmpR family, sensor histidine kinase CreC